MDLSKGKKVSKTKTIGINTKLIRGLKLWNSLHSKISKSYQIAKGNRKKSRV